MGWSRLQQPGTAYRAYCLIVACFVPLLRRTIVYHLVQPSFFTTSWCFFVCVYSRMAMDSRRAIRGTCKTLIFA
jgi:hypothetical protein